MNTKRLLGLAFILFLLVSITVTLCSHLPSKNMDRKGKDADDREEQGAADAEKYLWSLRVNPATGTIDVNDVINARKQVEAMAEANRNQRMKSGSFNLQWEELGPDNIGGRTRAILFDKNNPDHMFAGGVGGGLFRSTDHGQSWYVVNDQYQNLSVSCITQASNGDIYLGTGEGLYAYYGTTVGSFPGEGIWKSTDGGNTFKRLGSTWDNLTAAQQANWITVNNIYADPSNPLRIYAATGNGLRMSPDSGHTWINPVRTNMNGALITTTATTVKVATDGTVICSLNGVIYISDSAGKCGNDSTFKKVTTIPVSGRAELAVAPSNPNVMYACVASGSALSGIYRTTDKFKTVSVIGPGGGSFNPMGIALLVVCLLLIWRHRSNIHNLMNGTESRIGSQDSKKDAKNMRSSEEKKS